MIKLGSFVKFYQWILKTIVISTIALIGISAEARVPLDHPNVIIVYLDDSGYADYDFTGNTGVKTPNLRKMKDEGLSMNRFYSGSPVCSASRYALMTGKSPARSEMGVSVLRPHSVQYIRPQEQTIPETMKKAGYVTGMIGKWHLGVPNKANRMSREALPLAHGFDSYIGIPYSNDMKPTPLLKQPGNSQSYPGADVLENPVNQDHLTQFYFDRACDFINEHKSRPFFLYLAPSMPHYPLHASPDFRGKASSGRLYDDVIQEIDHGIGRLLKTLEEACIERNTLIFFSSDNGPWLAMGPKNSGCALPFRDGKGSNFEGGVHVVGLFYWPGIIKAGQTNDSLSSVLDIHPTLCDLVHQPFTPTGRADGRSLASLIHPQFGSSKELLPDDYVLILTGKEETISVMTAHWKNWKLHIDTYSQLWSNQSLNHNSPRVKASMDKPLLYDLSKDIAETTNVADQHPEIVEFMKQKIIDFKKTLSQ